MNKKANQTLLENKKPRSKKSLVLLISLLIVLLLCSLVFVTYLWISLAHENKIDPQLILDIKNDIKKSIVDSHIKTNSNKLNEHQKLIDESFDNLSSKIFDIENNVNKNQKNYENILLTLTNLEKNLNELNLKSSDSKQNDAYQESKASYQSQELYLEVKLEETLDNLKYLTIKGIPWTKDLDQIFQSKNNDLLSNFSNELNTLRKYSKFPPPSIDILKEVFNLLIPSILNLLPTDGESFFEEKINWVFKSIKLRRASGSDGIQPYDYVSNIEQSLKLNDLNNIIQNFQALPEKMKEPALKWFDKILIRNEIETALNTIIQNSREFIK